MDLRGASADSLRELTAELDEALRAGSHAERVAGELYDVATLLRAEPSLRRFADRRVAAGRGQAGVRPAGLRGQGRRRHAGAGHQRRGTPLDRHPRPAGRDRATQRDRRREVGRAATPTGWPTSCSLLGQTVTANPDLRDALANPARSTADKAALLDSLLGGKALPATVALAKQSLGGTYRTITGALAAYREVAAAGEG